VRSARQEQFNASFRASEPHREAAFAMQAIATIARSEAQPFFIRRLGCAECARMARLVASMRRAGGLVFPELDAVQEAFDGWFIALRVGFRLSLYGS
jgi:hypothetical protein